MAFDGKSLDDYVDVAERIAAFYERYPDGSLQPASLQRPWEQVLIEGRDKNGEPNAQTFVCYTACAYRTADDARPGVGIAWEVFPGRTPYTRGSEIMNAETSAWGRAIAALGIATRKGIASRQEVAQARDRQDGLPVNRDGSLSRSRTTDAEKRQAGVMTDAQLREHNALRRDGEATPERVSGPLGTDEWTVDGREDQPGTITAAQRTAIMAALATVGVNTRDARLAKLSSILDAKVGSTNELSYSAAARVLEHLNTMASAGVRS